MFSNTAVRVIEVVCGLGGFAAVLAIGWLVVRPMMKPARPSYTGVGVELLNSMKPGWADNLGHNAGAELARMTKAEEIGQSLRQQVYWRTCSRCGDVDRDSIELALAHAADLALEWAAQQCDAAKYRADKYQFAEIAERIRAGKSEP